jgi:hypothetical protein
MFFELLTLLLVFQLKHLVVDYYLQTPRMYGNKGKPYGWFWPLVEHAGVHAVATFLILVFFFVLTSGFTLSDAQVVGATAAAFDFVTHFITDRWKATRKHSSREPQFWINLGWDQMIHHIVGILIVFWVVALNQGMI